MKNENNSFYEYFNDSFYEYLADIKQSLYKKDLQYQKLSNKISEIQEKYPNVRKIMENDNPHKLDSKEINALIKLLNSELELNWLTAKELFIIGNYIGFCNYKKYGVINEKIFNTMS